jgi:tRNA pseudouridine38-40 synthase
MPRYKLTIEYDGTGLVGWQRQDNGPSVQGFLEAAVARLAGRATPVAAAGRTDAGVHATGQVVHFDLDQAMPTARLRDAVNFWLRDANDERLPVAALTAELVSDRFHARFSATSRSYLYRIANRRPPVVLERDRVWWVSKPLDAEAMHTAAQGLVGHHDFSSFRAAECQAKTPFRTLDRLDVERVGETILVRATARSFLHHQVRNIVGSLRLVGEGKWTAVDLKTVLDLRDRTRAGPKAPAGGLYFTEVLYEQGDGLVDKQVDQEADDDDEGGGAAADLQTLAGDEPAVGEHDAVGGQHEEDDRFVRQAAETQ